MSEGKSELLVRMTTYISICLSVQYFLYMLNLTEETNPSPYPQQLKGYPMHSRHDGAHFDFASKGDAY